MKYTTPNDDGVTVTIETDKYRITHNPYVDTFPYTLWVSFHGRWVMDSTHATVFGATDEADALGVA